MKVTIIPSKAHGTVNAPPSKSIAHRMLICGALSTGSRVNNIAYSNDISATLSCLQSLGAEVSREKDSVSIGGLDLSKVKEDSCLFCDESGSTLRFLIPLCLISGKRVTLKGSPRLLERPLKIYEDICNQQGFTFEKTADSLTVCGQLKSGFYTVPGNVSSQFITGMLFALPLLDGISILEITGDFESASYVDITLDVLASYGIKITRAGNRFIIHGNQTYIPSDQTVEGDASNAAFLSALNVLGGDVCVTGLNKNSLQGDSVYSEMFEAMANGKKEFDLSDCPDLAPIMFAVSAYFGGALFNGTSRLRLKESDRGQTMKTELSKFGITAEIGDNHIRIHKSKLSKPTETLYGHNDHRIVMSLAVISTLTGGVIEGAEAVSKSFPDFFDVLTKLNIGIRYEA